MGYYISQRAAKFKILATKFEDARKAILTLKGEETITDGGGPHFSWVTDGWYERKTLVGMLGCWRWEAPLDEEGNILDMNFMGEKAADDELLFQKIAPFVENGSYIEMQGEQGEVWRWIFEDGVLHEREAVIDFSSEMDHAPELLNMLEQLLSITEPFSDNLDPKDRDAWLQISARTADIRSGEKV